MTKLDLGDILRSSLAYAAKNGLVLLIVGAVSFFVVPLLLASARTQIASTALPGGSIFSANLPADRIEGLVVGLIFSLVTYMLGALSIGAICVAAWPSIAGRFDKPTLRSIWIDLAPSWRMLLRTGAIIGLSIWLVQSIGGLLGSSIGRDLSPEFDTARYLDALSAAELTAQLSINVIVTCAVLFLAVRFFLTVPVVVFERIAGIPALERSRELVRGNSWRVLWLLLLVGTMRQLAWTSLAAATVSATDDAVGFAVKLLPACVDLIMLTLLGLWMGAAYVSLSAQRPDASTDRTTRATSASPPST